MRPVVIRLATSLVLGCLVFAAVAAQQKPVPPVKPGLWEARMSGLDADGREVPLPEQAALANMPPEMKAKMAEAMKARGLTMPDANGMTKVCLTKEMFDSGDWEQLVSQAGCTMNYSTVSKTNWKWHSSCPSLKSESDGEIVFESAERYRTKITSTVNVMGKTTTTTRLVQAKWAGADCGDVKPLSVPGGRK
jgi:hypothetical protein